MPAVIIKQFQDVADGVHNSRFPMHHHDFTNAARVKSEYLGRDVEAEQAVKHFYALPDEQQAAMHASGYYGEYGSFHHASKPMTWQALLVIQTALAREIIEAGLDLTWDSRLQDKVQSSLNLASDIQAKLEDASVVTSMLANFPDSRITVEMIENVRQPYEAHVPA